MLMIVYISLIQNWIQGVKQVKFLQAICTYAQNIKPALQQ